MASPEPIPGRCGAKVLDKETRQLKGYCTRFPCTAQKRCPSHGGNSPQAKNAALVRVEQKKIAREFTRLGIERVDDPVGAMHDTISEATAWLNHLRGYVEDLQGDYASFSGAQGEQVKAAVKLYTEALDRAHRFLESWVRLGMDERRLALDAAKTKLGVDALVAALDAAFTAEGVPPDLAGRLKHRIGEELKKVTRG